MERCSLILRAAAAEPGGSAAAGGDDWPGHGIGKLRGISTLKRKAANNTMPRKPNSATATIAVAFILLFAA